MKKIIFLSVISLFIAKHIFAGGLEFAPLSTWAKVKYYQKMNYSYEALIRANPKAKHKAVEYQAIQLTACIDEIAIDGNLHRMNVSEATLSCFDQLDY